MRQDNVFGMGFPGGGVANNVTFLNMDNMVWLKTLHK